MYVVAVAAEIVGFAGGGGVASAAAELFALFDVAGVLGLGLVDDPGVPGRELQFLFGGDTGLQLAAPFHFGVQFCAEQQRQVGDPQPEQEDDHPGQRPVGFVVIGELRDV